MSKRAKVKAEDVRRFFDYDSERGRLIRIRNITAGRIGRTVGHINRGSGGKNTYLSVCFGDCNWQNSWLVWAWHNGEFPPDQIIHKNGNTLDDRIENLALYRDMRRPVQVANSLPAGEQPETMFGDLPEDLNTGIYEIRNIKNGRRYVGSAVNVSKRWREHLRQLETGKHHSRFMQRCWNKNGGENFIFRVLKACEVGDLIAEEQEAIDAIKPEYNSVPTAGSQLGYRHTEETRKKMSKSRPKDFSPMTGKCHSEETKEKIRRAKKGVKHGPYGRARVEKAAAAMRKTKSQMTEDKVRLVRSLREQGRTYKSIADQVGCTWHVVHDIIRGRTFSWVT